MASSVIEIVHADEACAMVLWRSARLTLSDCRLQSTLVKLKLVFFWKWRLAIVGWKIMRRTEPLVCYTGELQELSKRKRRSGVSEKRSIHQVVQQKVARRLFLDVATEVHQTSEFSRSEGWSCWIGPIVSVNFSRSQIIGDTSS